MNRKSNSVFLRVLVTAVACVGLFYFLYQQVGDGIFNFVVGKGEDASTYELLNPQRVLLLALLPIVALVATFSLADLPRAQKWLGVLLRMSLLSALIIALARPARTSDATKVSTVFLVDVSESVTAKAIVTAQKHVLEAYKAKEDNDVQLVTFAERAHRKTLAGNKAFESDDEETLVTWMRNTGSKENAEGKGSNLQTALQLAYGLFPPGHLRRAVLISDGGQTSGDLLAEATRAKAFGVTLHYHPYSEAAPKEVAITKVTIPERTKVGQPFHVRAEVYSTSKTKARIRLYQGETLNGLDSIRDVELNPGNNEVEFDSIVRVAGPVTYRAELAPEDADRFAANNRYETSVIVPGRPTVLYVEGAKGRGTYLARALAAADFDVDVRGPRAIPTSTRELERFDFFVLSDVSSDQVSLTQMDAIERYVRDLGGGFIMAGGGRSFGLGGWQNTRMERLLPVRMDSERRRDQPSLGLALVIDRSGSMTGQKIQLAKEAAKATAELLSGDDFIEVIGFDSRPERIVRMQSAGNRVRILRDISRLNARGGTRIFPALDQAYQDLSVTRARIKHVILLTDGQTGEPNIPELVQVMRAESITVSTVGLGSDVNRALLQSVAKLGGGRSYFTSDPSNVPKIFMRETTTVARSSAVEEYFQPSVVTNADFLRGINVAGSPYLHGYVATRMKPAPAQQILKSDIGEPILARWRVGLGWAMAWTSDVKNRWAVEWLKWPGFSRFWAQLVREHMRKRHRQSLDMTASVQDGEVHVVVDAIGGDDQFLNGLESTLKVKGPMGGKKRKAAKGKSDEASESLTFKLRQTAPGRYEARFPLSKYGSFVLSASHRRDGRAIAQSTANLSNPYPLEYATLEPDEALLKNASATTGGKASPTVAQLFDPGAESIKSHEELWPKFLLLGLLLFVLDLLLRRVRIFDRQFRSPRPSSAS